MAKPLEELTLEEFKQRVAETFHNLESRLLKQIADLRKEVEELKKEQAAGVTI